MIYGYSTVLVFLLLSFQSDSFKNDQLRYSRVRQAYEDKEENMTSLLRDKRIEKRKLRIYIRAFKSEKQIELWGKNDSGTKYKLIKTYSVCRTSGGPGPKRKQGDFQIPEGFYHIDRFNPYSNYYLSLGINYPNKSDKILGNKSDPGDNIFIHGGCVTIGCLPITDDQIKELYIFCVDARNYGQRKIPVTIFPSKLSDREFKRLIERYNSDIDRIGLWTDLKEAYDIFNKTKQIPTIVFLRSGRHVVQN